MNEIRADRFNQKQQDLDVNALWHNCYISGNFCFLLGNFFALRAALSLHKLQPGEHQLPFRFEVLL